MRVLSVNVGLPREVIWRGKSVTTGIYKEPVEGECRSARSTSTAIGRPTYASTAVWTKRSTPTHPSSTNSGRVSDQAPARPGYVRRDLTTEGLLDESVSVGDRYRVGTAELVVTQPRLPCFKLGIKMRRDEFVTEFLERGLLGFYLAVAREGEVEAGDPIVQLSRDPRGFGVPRSRASTPATVTTSKACSGQPSSMCFPRPGATTFGSAPCARRSLPRRWLSLARPPRLVRPPRSAHQVSLPSRPREGWGAA